MGAENSNIEVKAVSFLNSLFSSIDILEPHIETFSTQMIWDGYINVFKTKNHTKDDFVGRVPVQVKGTQQDYKGKKVIKYNVDYADIKGFNTEFGAIFFIVSISSMESCQVYYSLFTQYDTRKLLAENTGGKKSKSLVFRKLEKDKRSSITNVFTTFIIERKKQRVDDRFLSLSSIDKSRILGLEISIPIPIGEESVDSKSILDNEYYLYADIKDAGIFTVEKFSPVEVSFHQESPILVGDEEFYSGHEVKVSSSKSTIIWGNEICFDTTSSKLSLTIKGTLFQQIRDIKFIIACYSSGSFTIGETVYRNSKKSISSEISSMTNRLEYLESCRTMLTLLRVDCDIDIGNFDSQDLTTLQALNYGIMHKGIVRFDRPFQWNFARVKLSDLILFVETEEFEHGSKIVDYFQNNNKKINIESDLYVNKYILLNVDDYVVKSNCHLEQVAKSLRDFEYNDRLYFYHVWILLNILSAYDKELNIGTVRYDLLGTATEVSILFDDQIKSNSTKLNRLQTIKRARKLTFEESTELNELFQVSVDEEEKIGALILLDFKKEAMECFNRLPDKRRRVFMSYPIWNLLSKT